MHGDSDRPFCRQSHQKSRQLRSCRGEVYRALLVRVLSVLVLLVCDL